MQLSILKIYGINSSKLHSYELSLASQIMLIVVTVRMGKLFPITPALRSKK
jgi:hypothetical protein